MIPEQKEYSQDATYRKGDILYHPVLKKEGKIKKIEIIARHRQKLYVTFEDIGEKVLIAGIENES